MNRSDISGILIHAFLYKKHKCNKRRAIIASFPRNSVVDYRESEDLDLIEMFLMNEKPCTGNFAFRVIFTDLFARGKGG